MSNFLCPVCGYGMHDEPTNYNICPSCGTEFGLHDQNASVAELRDAWIQSGPSWWSKTDPVPPGWDPLAQLERVTVPQVKPVVRVVFAVQKSQHHGVVATGTTSNSLEVKSMLPTTTTNVTAAKFLETSHR
jgi:hypothetical protein